MKKNKAVIAILMVLVIICSFAACSSNSGNDNEKTVTQAVTGADGEAVTNENGEVVTESVNGELVTDKDGKTVTEAVTDKNGEKVTNPDGKTVTQAKIVNASDSSSNAVSSGTAAKNDKTDKKDKTTTTTKKDDTTTTTKKPVKKPSAPANVSSLKTSNATADSVKLTWSKVDCTGYQLQMKTPDTPNWTYLEKSYTKGNTYTVKGLTSLTKYQFRVRAYNENAAGKTASKAWADVTITTKENDTSKYLTITIMLPADENKQDTLTISIDGKVVHTATVVCDGSEYVYKTDKKYKGAVTVSAALKDEKISRAVKTDKNTKLDLSVKNSIDQLYGEDD